MDTSGDRDSDSHGLQYPATFFTAGFSNPIDTRWNSTESIVCTSSCIRRHSRYSSAQNREYKSLPLPGFQRVRRYPDNPFTNHWDGAVTTPQIGTNGVAKIRPLGSIWNSGDAVLAGRVEWRLGKFFARMQGRNQTTLNYFDGVIELEKPV